MIRAATPADLPVVLDLGEKMHALSSYARFSFDRQKVFGMFANVMRGNGIVYVVERQGRVVGGIAGGVAEFWFGHDIYGFDYAFFVDPEFQHGVSAFRLLLAFEEWCRLRGATEMRLGITTGINVDATARFYEWHGYSRSGVLFTKPIEHVGH